jgi:iron complex outermembrane receptor protein
MITIFRRPRQSTVVSWLALGAALAAPLISRAQTAPAATTVPEARLSEVVVTAERRTTDIQKTPTAITALPAVTLDKSFVTDVTGLNGRVPSLQSTKESGFENIVTIRGIGSGTPENDLTTVPGVSLFEDGVYLVNTISLSQTLFDVDRIEVLRGPQGALYGQSSIGGAINIVTMQPQLNSFASAVDVSAGTYDLVRARGWVNIPIGDTVAVRLSAQHFQRDGFTKDLAIPGYREDDADNTALKAALLWKPTDRFSATLTARTYRSNENGQAQKNVNDPLPSPWEIYQDFPAKSEITAQLYHLNMQYDFDAFSVRSVSGYQHLNAKLAEDSSRSAVSLLGSYDNVARYDTKLDNYSEEFDILSKPGGKLDWIIGGFYLNQRSQQIIHEFQSSPPNFIPYTGDPADAETNPPANLAYGNDSHVKRESESVFGQATYHFLPTLRLTVGGRYNHDTLSDDSFNFSAFGSGTANYSKSDSVPTWRAEVDYDATPDNLLYASVARGYKPGGVNGKNGQVVVPVTFKPETNTAFEVGSKNSFFDHSLRVNLAGFYYVYKDMQYIETDPIPFDGGIANIPSVHIYGVEAEANYVGMGDHLRINGNISLEDGKVQGDYFTIDSTVANAIENQPYPSPCAYGGAFYNPACFAQVIAAERNIRGKTPPAMPKVSGSINASYAIDLPFGVATPRVEVVYRGSEYARIFNEPGLDNVPAYTQVDLNLDFVPTGSKFRFAVTATNVGNVAGINSKYIDPYGTAQTSLQYVAPRQVIFTVGYGF